MTWRCLCGSTINDMIDEHTKCPKCGANASAIADLKFMIKLKCPRCLREKEVPKESFDPIAAAVAITLCPECVDETLAHEPGTDYEDSNGKPVFWNGEA